MIIHELRYNFILYNKNKQLIYNSLKKCITYIIGCTYFLLLFLYNYNLHPISMTLLRGV